MMDFGFDLDLLIRDAGLVLLAFALSFPIGWERGQGKFSVGFRTMPIVAMAACGFSIIIDLPGTEDVEARARILQGIITGIGFIGGGAIVKSDGNVLGLVTAASIWNAGAIGAAVGLGHPNIALVLSVVNIISLWLLSAVDTRKDIEK